MTTPGATASRTSKATLVQRTSFRRAPSFTSSQSISTRREPIRLERRRWLISTAWPRLRHPASSQPWRGSPIDSELARLAIERTPCEPLVCGGVQSMSPAPRNTVPVEDCSKPALVNRSRPSVKRHLFDGLLGCRGHSSFESVGNSSVIAVIRYPSGPAPHKRPFGKGFHAPDSVWTCPDGRTHRVERRLCSLDRLSRRQVLRDRNPPGT